MPSQIAQRTTSDSGALARRIARAALDKQAEDVVVMDIRAVSTVADFFVVGTAGSTRQLNALKEHVEAVLSQQGCRVRHTEGLAAAHARMPAVRRRRLRRRPHQPETSLSPPHEMPQWVLMDCGELVVHLFDHHARSFYRLEELWADAPRVPIDAMAEPPPRP